MDNRRIDIVVDLETLGVENDAQILQLSMVCFDIFTGRISSVFNTVINPDFENKITKVNIDTLKWWTRNPDRVKILNRLLNGESTESNFENILYNTFNASKHTFANNNQLAVQFANYLVSVCKAKNEISKLNALEVGSDVCEIYLLKDIHLWGNGINFDNAIIKELCLKEIEDYPIDFRMDSDIRTLLDMTVENRLVRYHSKGETYDGTYTYIKDKVLEMVAESLHTTVEELGAIKHNAMFDCYYEAKLISYCFNQLVG